MQYCILPVKHLLRYIRLLLSCFSPKAGITTINFLVFSNIYRTPTSMLVFLFCVYRLCLLKLQSIEADGLLR